MERGESSSDEQYERVFYSPYSEHQYCTAIRSIDTVRALHQTVVSLRTALDESRQEIEKLKKQILVTNEIQDARQCTHPVNFNNQQIDYKALGDKVSELEKIYYKAHPKETISAAQGDAHSLVDDNKAESSSSNNEEQSQHKTKKDKSDVKRTISLVPDITISTQNLNDSNITSSNATGGNTNNNQMASRIDVKIKVSSNINVSDNNDTSTDVSSEVSSSDKNKSNDDNNSEADDVDESKKPDDEPSNIRKRENPKVEVEMYEDSNTNTFNVDAKNLKIKVTSEDSINVRKSVERISVQQSSTEYLNLDIDDLSEGDNSVFTEGATTPIEQRLQQVEEIGSDEAVDESGELPREEREEPEDIPEEVDDIELIFSSDDNKDMIQEDLVSLSEYEPWQEPGGTGTPVLTRFSTLTSDDADREAYYQKKKALKAARMQAREAFKDKSLESADSLSFDNNNPKLSSFEKESSIDDPISRDNSVDALTKPAIAKGGASKKWTNINVLVETDISKVGIGDENGIDIGRRRNTCPNPPIYRPLSYSQNRSSFRNSLAAKYPRSIRNNQPLTSTATAKANFPFNERDENKIHKNNDFKCNTSAQTDISALSHQWRSETQLIGTDYCLGGYTLPSKYNSPKVNTNRSGKSSLRLSEKTQEARRILLSDINFTSMVPELSRSADHLCQQKINEEVDENADYFKGNLLKTPDYSGRGLTPSTSTQGVSQWTVNESTTQTEGFWNNRNDSFDSSKSYSMRSGNQSSSMLTKHQRSRSVPSFRCVICKQNHSSLKPSESMHYTKTVTFREPLHKSRGSLPDLRHDCHICPRRHGSSGKSSQLYRMHESSGSTESLLEEADDYLRYCGDDKGDSNKRHSRICSDVEVHRDCHQSKHPLPFLPKSPKCLKTGQQAKVIAKGGRIVVGKIRYIGHMANDECENDIYVGLQLPHAHGDNDGTFNGRKFFECESNCGVFVPFKKVVMAWN